MWLHVSLAEVSVVKLKYEGSINELCIYGGFLCLELLHHYMWSFRSFVNT